MAYRNYSTANSRIVDPSGNGDFTTIAAALTAASTGQTIFIRPATYTENLTLKAGVNLVAYDADALTPNVTIVGKCTFTAAGTVSISGIQLKTNSDFFLAVTGSAASIVYLKNCYLNCTNNTGISFTTSSGSANIYIYNCAGDLGTTGIGLYTSLSAGEIWMQYCYITNTGASTTVTTASAGVIDFKFCAFSSPISTTSTAGIFMQNCNLSTSTQNATSLTANGTGASGVQLSLVQSGTASAISVGTGATLTLTNCDVSSSNTNAITGAGTLNYGGIDFYGSSTTINTTTTSPVAYAVPQGGTGISSVAAGSTYGVLCAGTTTTGAFQVVAHDSSTTKVLTSGGSAAIPSWQPSTGVGNLVLIQTQTASSSASITFTTSVSTYNNLYMVYSNIQPGTGSTNLLLQISIDGGSTYKTTGYTAGSLGNQYNNTSGWFSNANGTTAFFSFGAFVTTANNTGAGFMWLHDVNSGAYIKSSGMGTFINSTVYVGFSPGYNTFTGTNALKFSFSSGNIATGTFSLYGLLT